MKVLELGFEVDADEHGIINGVELAGNLIGYAIKLLAPYVSNCPACLDNIFGTVANNCLTVLHGDLAAGHRFDELARIDGTGDDECQAHLSAMQPLIHAMLEKEGHVH